LPDGEQAITVFHASLCLKSGEEMNLISDQRETGLCSAIVCVLEWFLLLCWFSAPQAELLACPSPRCPYYALPRGGSH